jgi:ATP-dependent protease ClpP protease subunit
MLKIMGALVGFCLLVVVTAVLGYLLIPINKEYVYTFDGEITEHSVTELVHKIRSIKETDRLTIHLSTVGGSVLAGYKIVDAMHRAKGTVHLNVPSYALSMGADLLCQADTYTISDFAIVMWHPMQQNGQSLLRSNKDLSAPERAFLDGMDMLMKKCSKFLTKKDFRDLELGKELWFTGKILKERDRQYQNGIERKERQGISVYKSYISPLVVTSS